MQLFHVHRQPRRLRSPATDYEAPVDGLHLLQEYVRAPRPFITRAEFVGGRFLYAVEVDTSDGFELCPADACAVGDANCPVGEAPRDKFTIIDGIPDALRGRLERFLAATGVEVAGIEFITDTEGRTLVYDVNTNTNYNPDAEARAGRTGTARSGPGAIARVPRRRTGAAIRGRLRRDNRPPGAGSAGRDHLELDPAVQRIRQVIGARCRPGCSSLQRRSR